MKTFDEEILEWAKQCQETFLDPDRPLPTFRHAVKVFERGLIRIAMAHSQSRAAAARLLHLKRTTLLMKCQEEKRSTGIRFYVTIELDETVDCCLDCFAFRNGRCLAAREEVRYPEWEGNGRPDFCRIKSQVPTCPGEKG